MSTNHFFQSRVFFLGIPGKYKCSPTPSEYFDPIPGVLGSNRTPGGEISKIVKNHFFTNLKLLQRFDEVKTLRK